MKAKENVTFVLGHQTVEVLGTSKVTGIKLDTPFEGSEVMNVDGVFIEIGSDPQVALPLQLGCVLDDRGFLKVDNAMQTSVPGVYGAGDVTSASNHFAQFTTAAGEATVAANSVFTYLQGHS